MSTTAPETTSNASNQLPKLGFLEEDDEFEEFPIEDWDVSGELKLDVEQWEADWDDDNIDDEFSNQLRAELQKLGNKQQ